MKKFAKSLRFSKFIIFGVFINMVILIWSKYQKKYDDYYIHITCCFRPNFIATRMSSI